MIKPPFDRVINIIGSLFVTFLATGLALSLSLGAVHGYGTHGLSTALWHEVFGKFANTLLFSGLMAFMAMLLTGLPLLAVIVWAEVKRIRNVWIHLGIAVAFSLLFSPIAAVSEASDGAQVVETLVVSTFSACAGAITYWALAGRNAGCWQQGLD